MFKLRRLRIEKYRNVAPETELLFDDTFNVLLGQNGTGKTTLLNLLSMVARGDFSPLKHEDFALSYELRDDAVPCEISVQIAHAAPDKRANWSSSVVLRLPSYDRTLQVHTSALGASLEDSSRPEQRRALPVLAPTEEGFVLSALIEMLAAMGKGDPPHAVGVAVLRAGQNANCTRFDESLGAFQAMTEAAAAFGLLRPPHRPEPMLLSPTFLPRSLAEGLRSRRSLSLGQEELRFASEDLSFLNDAVALMKFRSAELRLSRLKKEVRGQSERLLYGEFKFYFTDEDGSQISHDFLSYGQKRLLAFFYYLAANEQMVIADELVNGMHHEWIEACRDALGERQAFLTSQNPLLLDYLPFESAAEAQRTFILCSCAVEQGQKRLRWRNIAEADAADFFRAYQAGVQHVSAILRTKGLW